MSELPDYVRDTIAAAATPSGKGSIGIVRISGDDAALIATRMLGYLPEPRVATHARFLDKSGEPIDTGIALWFPGPDSFTGESVLELQGHGGPIVIAIILQTILALGARCAEPGEFSRRAFLNGKLDLAQVEAIVDLINSGTRQAARAAYRSLTGHFSGAVETLSENLIRLRLHVEAAIDFPEEDIDFLSDGALKKRIDLCAEAFDELLEKAGTGRLLRDGFQLVIVGKPNVGKSSLLNLLSGQDAAIVTEYAGTTRDILRERIDVDGLAVELVDTAGIREVPDAIEAEGIRRARQALDNADAVLWIQDITEIDKSLPDGTDLPDVPLVVVRNKIDLTDDAHGPVGDHPLTLNMSAHTGAGLEALTTAIKTLAGYMDHGEGAFTARQRHIDALQTAANHFACGRRALNNNQAGELFAEELRLAQDSLARICGAFSSDDLLGRIFSDFCIGK